MLDSLSFNRDRSDPPPRQLRGRGDRLRAHLLSLFIDHGIFRAAYRNWHEIAPGVYRSNQPSPAQIERAARAGVRTVVNLRGQSNDSYHLLERDACARLGLELIDFKVFSRELPSAKRLHEIGRLFETIRYPALMHCKSGADRVGLMSVLYLLVHERRPLEEALRQLGIKYGHYRQARTGILDKLFEAYGEYHAKTGTDFYTWVDTAYDRKALTLAFHENRWASILVDWILMRE